MSEFGVIFILFAAGVIILVAEIFIPSHGVLSVVGLGFVVAGIIKTFSHAGREAGMGAVIVCLVVLPTMAYLAVKYWHKTPIGRRIAPPNPVLTVADTSVPVEELRSLIGRTGRAVSPLRPVGLCEFDGRRISCVAELGIVESGTEVVGVGITSGNLAVQVKTV